MKQKGSNLRMSISKTDALPLGYASKKAVHINRAYNSVEECSPDKREVGGSNLPKLI